MEKLVSESTDSKNIFIIQTHYVFKNGPSKVIFGPFSMIFWVICDHLNFHLLCLADWVPVWVDLSEFKKANKFQSMQMAVIWYLYINEEDHSLQKNSVFMQPRYFLVSQDRLLRQ